MSLHIGDALGVLKTFPDQTFHNCVTSPPYWGLRDYGQEGQLGLEESPEEYVANMVEVFREVRRVLRDDGTLWLNLGDSYAGSGGYSPDSPCNKARARGESWGAMNAFTPSQGEARRKQRPGYTPPGLKPKDLVGIPWRVALALQADGWYLRSDIIWHKPNPMPESVTDRPTKAHEYIFLLSKSPKYFYDADAIKEDRVTTNLTDTSTEARRKAGHPSRYGNTTSRSAKGCGMPSLDNGSGTRNKRSVWAVKSKPYSGAHFATFPPDLIKPCILAGCPEGGTVLDPFMGSGTTARVAMDMGRKWCGIELNPEFGDLIRQRTSQMVLWDLPKGCFSGSE